MHQNKPHKNKAQSNGNNSGSHNTIVNNYGTIYGGVSAESSSPEPPKGGRPLIVKAVLVIVIVVVLALAPHASPVLMHVVPEIIKTVFGAV